MKTIAAIIPRKSYAPELYALKDYLDQKGEHDLRLISADEGAKIRESADYDAVYIKMGFAPFWKPGAVPEIHDYSSASTGHLRRTKDKIKSHLSRRPVLRSYLAEPVRERFSFRDNVPYIHRDMGVPEAFITAGSARSDSFEFDLFYAGSITESRRSAELFRAVAHAGLTVLAAGLPQPTILEEFKTSSHVTFSGPVPYEDIPMLAEKCRFGVNYTPDVPPFNFQTSTKVLEYLSLGLPVVTNDYQWVRQFESESGARMAKLHDIGNLSKSTLEFGFQIPDMTKYSWGSIFEKSGISEALRVAL